GTAYLAEAERSTLDDACSPVTVSAPSSRGSSLRAASSARAGEGGGGSGDSINIRGFSANANMQVDGLRDSAQTSRSDLFNL
ncbi:TonB-dependent receptor plug domain-containing protein, partial [Pseudomonas aeruginosa]|uniref:TonB-dependent receptor plug domain-containing protein n=1 Tax=Pseudomonas aeruginosa TaxID=287 RepID=UPI0039821B79